MEYDLNLSRDEINYFGVETNSGKVGHMARCGPFS